MVGSGGRENQDFGVTSDENSWFLGTRKEELPPRLDESGCFGRTRKKKSLGHARRKTEDALCCLLAKGEECGDDDGRDDDFAAAVAMVVVVVVFLLSSSFLFFLMTSQNSVARC